VQDVRMRCESRARRLPAAGHSPGRARRCGAPHAGLAGGWTHAGSRRRISFMSARMEVEIPTAASRFVASFLPLRNRNLRVYLSGQVISLIGTWMQVTAQAWVVWSLSHSTTALGLVAMLGTLPILVLGPCTGV